MAINAFFSESNIAPQQIDGFQWRIGNPNLKTASSYMLTFRYNFNLPHVAGTFGVRAFNSPNAITPYLYWDENKLITSYEKQPRSAESHIFPVATNRNHP